MKLSVRMLLAHNKSILQAAGTVLLASVALTVAMVYLLAAVTYPAQAQGTIRYVAQAPAGSDAGDCSNPAGPCATVQYAVDQAQAGDEIRVAKGLYTDVHVRAGITQVVYISKSVTVRGGYAPSNWSNADPVANRTRLNAQGVGRVAVISGTGVAATLEGLIITGGNATGLGAHSSSSTADAGGGVYIDFATATISQSVIYSNTASTAATGYGGGMYLYASASQLVNNIIRENQASTTGIGEGGGIYLSYSGATVTGNTIQENTASRGGINGVGGGMYVHYSTGISVSNNTVISNTANTTNQGSGGGIVVVSGSPFIQNNTIQGNMASVDQFGNGGGVYLSNTQADLHDNTIINNTASMSNTGDGGGMYVTGSDAVLQNNTIQDNKASQRPPSSSFYSKGGGVYLVGTSTVTLLTNTIQTNIAADGDYGQGGGLYVANSVSIMQGNTITGNVASLLNSGYGGGLYLASGSDGTTLQANTITGNTASQGSSGYGGGVYAKTSSITIENNILQSNTSSTANTGYGGGAYFWDGSVLFQKNRVISNTARLNNSTGYGGGLYVFYSNPLTLTNNLVAGNRANTTGSGVYIGGSTSKPVLAIFRHNTVADNTGKGQGMYVGSNVTATLTGTIIAGHTLEGIYVDSSGMVSLEATLWHNNGTDTAGAGSITSGAVNLSGNPAFVDSSAWDYHLGPGSAAIDAGVDAGITGDLDGDARPYAGGIPDIGADEAANRKPIASAGASQTVAPDAGVTLDGSASSDPDGGSLSYGWIQTGGPAVSLSSAAVVSPTFTAPSLDTVLTFTLTVTDSFNLSQAAMTTITVSATQGTPQEQVFLPLVIKE